MLNGLCRNIDLKCIYMKEKKNKHGQRYKAGYPKQFQEGTST